MPASQTPPTDPGLSHREILEILAGLLAALFTAVLSSTIVSNALPTIIADLEGSQTQYTWVITASLLAMTVSTPPAGEGQDPDGLPRRDPDRGGGESAADLGVVRG